jgi:hypothetical protein
MNLAFGALADQRACVSYYTLYVVKIDNMIVAPSCRVLFSEEQRSGLHPHQERLLSTVPGKIDPTASNCLGGILSSPASDDTMLDVLLQ